MAATLLVVITDVTDINQYLLTQQHLSV